MKKILYAGIFSALMSGCAAPQTTFVDYPVVVDVAKSTYTKDSNGNCYLKIPEAEGEEWRLYNEQCDETTDSVALVFQEHFLLYHDRKEFGIEILQFDALFLHAEDYLKNKEKKRGYNDIPF